MFQQLKNIDAAFRLTRTLSILSVVGSIGFSVFIVYFSQKQAIEKDKKIFVIANGKIFEAFEQERGKFWPIEIRDHIKTFHFYFFTLQPDEAFIKKNIEKALYLANNDAAGQYNNLRENGFYTSLLAANASQEIECENITINLNDIPWSFKYTGKLRIIRATAIVTRSLVTEGVLRITQPTDNNPHGLVIERWRVIENKDISTENR